MNPFSIGLNNKDLILRILSLCRSFLYPFFSSLLCECEFSHIRILFEWITNQTQLYITRWRANSSNRRKRTNFHLPAIFRQYTHLTYTIILTSPDIFRYFAWLFAVFHTSGENVFLHASRDAFGISYKS